MKQVCRANKSGEVFYIEKQTETEVTLRNPMTGMVKTIRGTTLDRAYTILTQEEIQMATENIMETTNTQEVVKDFTLLLDCATKADYETALADVAGKDFEDVAACAEFDLAKKIRANAVLTFKENMTRFENAKPEYKEAQEALAANPTDLDLMKAFESVKTSMQKYVNKMAMYLGKIAEATAKMEELKPAVEEAAE